MKLRKSIMRDLQMIVNVKHKEIKRRHLRNVGTVLTVKVSKNVMRDFKNVKK